MARILPTKAYPESKFLAERASAETLFGDDSIEVEPGAVYNGGDVQHSKISPRIDRDVDDYNLDLSVPLKTEKCEYLLHPKSSKFDVFLANLLENLPKETLTVTSPNEDDLLPIGYNFTEGFEYSLKPMILQGNYDDFSTFIELATRTFLNLNDVRSRLSYMHDNMIEPIPTVEDSFRFYAEYPLSKTNAWIWMCAEIVKLFEQSKNVLQDVRHLERCQNYIAEQLINIGEQIKSIESSFLDFRERFHQFNELFCKVNATIRSYFSEAISSEVEGLRLRFLEESEERSTGLITVLSRSSPATIQELEKEKNQFVRWGIDGLSIKTKNEFILLNYSKTNSARFVHQLKEFFGGFNNFLTRMSWVIYGINKAFTKQAHEPSSVLIKLLKLASTIYVYPMEQTRGVQVFWQLQEVIKESLHFITKLAHNFESIQRIWRTAFGNEIGKEIKFNVSFQPFMDWKLCKRLMFKLKILESELPKKSGALCLMVPNSSNNTPLFFQVFENNFCSIVDFEKEYEHRRERLKMTGKILQEDVLVCSDTLQHVYFISNKLTENVQVITEGFAAEITKISQLIQASNAKNFCTLNVWCFICTECLLSMNASNLKEAEKERILAETENCFHSVNQWIEVIARLKRKYSKELVRIQKLRKTFPGIIQENERLSPELSLKEDEGKQQRSFENISSGSSTNTKEVLSINLSYDAMFIEHFGHNYNIRKLQSPNFFNLTTLILNHTRKMVSTVGKVYTAALGLLKSRKSDGNKNIDTFVGIRQQIADIEFKLQGAVNFNPLEILISQLCLNNLYEQLWSFVEHLGDILSIRTIIKQDLEFPKKVLNQKLGRWWASKVNVNSVADHIGATIKLPINDNILESELKILIKRARRN